MDNYSSATCLRSPAQGSRSRTRRTSPRSNASRTQYDTPEHRPLINLLRCQSKKERLNRCTRSFNTTQGYSTKIWAFGLCFPARKISHHVLGGTRTRREAEKSSLKSSQARQPTRPPARPPARPSSLLRRNALASTLCLRSYSLHPESYSTLWLHTYICRGRET